MLTTETKQRINTARDILVGKVPDPKSQVEQITIAMIYKFMDDMDKEAIEFGGEPTFFAGEFDKYAWSKLFAPQLGGHEVLALYAEAIVRMNHNPNIPQLFRDIFKNAFLPYRDPETLKLFLKTINGFAYDHSEDLGDAFEYLLQVMGSQGDAGQFRTPRHIIDFMVNVVQPQKHETIADVACGTAGFLVSSYNYIRNQNTHKQKGDLLTPDDRKRLVENIKGYDISPDMVRLSLVNLYLHGFTNPQVAEYDTLTSEDNWNERFDVLLANPPFMSPKGGIKPHKRFSIQSNRSEVLFLDYIAEHLRPGGRAAVIVPEGIIFQSGTAYKALRKMLIDKYLWAVVSLPAGVFNPYSGVKTSILLLDRTLAPKTDSVLFVKVKADGYDLGAQRRPIDKDDLPAALNLLTAYRQTLLNGTSTNVAGEFVVNDDMGLVVEKERIVGSGEYNLSGERYRTVKTHNQACEIKKLGEVCEIKSGGTPSKDNSQYWQDGTIPWLKSEVCKNSVVEVAKDFISEAGFANSSTKWLKAGSTLIALVGATIGKTAFLPFEATTNQNVAGLYPKDTTELLPKFLFYACQGLYPEFVSLGEFRMANLSFIRNLEIPLPPLAVQQQIVTEIEGYQRIIDGARQVVEAYKPQIQIDPSWEMVALGEVCDLVSGQHIEKELYNSSKLGIAYLTGPADFGDRYPVITKWTQSPKVFAKEGDILVTVKGSGVGKINVLDIFSACISRQLMAVRPKNIDSGFLYHILKLEEQNLNSKGDGAAIPGITRNDLLTLQIPLPPLETQQRIVAKVEREQALVNANRELIALFEQKIKDRVAAVWGKQPEEVGQANTEAPVVPMPYAPMDEEVAMVAEE